MSEKKIGRPAQKRENKTELDRLMRKRYILHRLRKGENRANIEEEVQKRCGVSEATAKKDMKEAYEALANSQEDYVQHLKQVIFERYDQLYKDAYDKESNELESFEDYNLRISEKNYQIFIGEIKMSKTMDLYRLLRKEDNFFGYSSEVMNESLKSIGTAYANSNQKEAYENFTKVFIEETPFIPLFFRKESVVFEKGISGTTYPDMFMAYKNPQNWYKSTKK